MGQAYRTPDDIARLVEHELTPESLAPVTEAVALTVAALGPTRSSASRGAVHPRGVPGGGAPSRDHLAARTLMHADPESWARLTAWTAQITGAFLRAQVLAGASAAQLFDSWAGSLSLEDYLAGAKPGSTVALSQVSDLGVPAIHFGTGTGHLLGAMRDALTEAGVTHPTVGVDYRTPLDEAAKTLGGDVPVQGNIDPALLAAPWPVLEAHVRDVLRRGSAARRTS
ncbi:uroporphyrinogen decarboxylase family protein [Oerskovia sp. M15]